MSYFPQEYLVLKARDAVDVLVVGNYERLCPNLKNNLHFLQMLDNHHIEQDVPPPFYPQEAESHLGFADFAVETSIVPLPAFVLNLLGAAHKRLVCRTLQGEISDYSRYKLQQDHPLNAQISLTTSFTF